MTGQIIITKNLIAPDEFANLKFLSGTSSILNRGLSLIVPAIINNARTN